MKVILTLLVALLATSVLATDERYLTYADFIQHVEAGRIESVTVDKFSSIKGVIVEGATRSTFRSYADTGSANDPLLTRFLKEHHVSTTMGDVTETSHAMPMITGFIFMLIPVVFLILLIIVIVKLNHILANQKRNQKDVFEECANSARLEYEKASLTKR